MCFLHIPPENSPYTVKNGDDFDTLINDICKYSSSGDLMLCGDFNARTASDPEVNSPVKSPKLRPLAILN
jgi:hypothetical protein